MYHFRHIIKVILLFFFIYPASAQNNIFTLNEAVQYGLENNVQVQNHRLLREIADQQVRETRAIGLPHINGSVALEHYPDLPVSLVPAEFVGGPEGEFMELSFGTDFDLTATLTLNQLIFDGQYIVALQASREFRKLRDNELGRVRRDVKEQIAKSYYNAVLTAEVAEILEENIDQLEQTLMETRALFENGFIERLDVDRIRLRLNQVRTEFENAERHRQNALFALKMQMGYPVENPLNLSGSLDDYFEEQQMPEFRNPEQVFTDRIEHHVLKSQESVTHLDRRRYRAGYLPSLSAFATHRQNAQRDEFDFHRQNRNWFPSNVIGVTLNVPVFDGLEKNAIIQQKTLELKQLQNERFLLEQSIRTEIEEGLNNYSSAEAQLENRRENLSLASSIYEQTLYRYREGIGDSRSVTEAQTDLNNAQIEYLNAKTEILIARVNLEIAYGIY